MQRREERALAPRSFGKDGRPVRPAGCGGSPMTQPAALLRRHARLLAPACGVYAAPSAGIVLILGFSAGLPLALSGETLRLWMADCGIDLATIGLISLAGVPYSV